MKDITIENTSAPSTEMEKTTAEGKAVASNSNYQEMDFKLIDSLHSAAIDGYVSREVEDHGKYLDQILTPAGNTILHIHIISLEPKTDDQPKKPNKENNPKEKLEEAANQEAKFTTKVLEMCPNILLKANKKEETLLHFAARYGHGDIVEEILQECKKPCYKDQEDGVETTRLLLGKTNEAQDTALHEAVRYNHLDVVNKLIEADSDLPYDANGSGETPLYLAAERGYTEIVKKILECKSPSHDGPMGRTSLHAAVIRRDKEMAEDRLLEKKRSLSEQKDNQERLPLHYAAYLGYDEIVEYLLDINPIAAYQYDIDGMTALHLAAGNGKAKAVDKLISKCPSCWELVDKKSGQNALHFALTSENDDTVQIFLANPSLRNLINQRDGKGDTPLLQLAASGYFMRSFISHQRVDKLAFNTKNQNAADIILARDLIMDPQESFLRQLGMIKNKRYRRIIVPKEESKEEKVNRPSILGFRSYYVKAKDGSDDIIEKTKEADEPPLLVVATLIATVTFAAGFTLPGGYNGEDSPNEGAAILTRSTAFQAFVIFDTIAFVLSCLSVLIHLTIELNKNEILRYEQHVLTCYAMTAMMFAFVTGIYAVLYPDKTLAITACVIGSMFGWIPYLQLSKPLKQAVDMLLVKKKLPTPRTTFYED